MATRDWLPLCCYSKNEPRKIQYENGIPSIKCVMVGDGCSGKTYASILYATKKVPEFYTPTVSDKWTKNIELDGEEVQLQLWDTAGQDDYDNIRPRSYPGTDVIMVAFNLGNENSLDNMLSKWYPEINSHAYMDVPQTKSARRVKIYNFDTKIYVGFT